jgi:Saxitoxin biosynthesis operon protein SxtJ
MTGASPRELRRFGLTVGGAFALLGALSRWRGHDSAPLVLWTLGGLLVVPALVWPAILGPVRHYWMRGAMVLGEINSRIILGVFYFLVMAPLGLVMRRFRDPLDRSLTDGRASDWIQRKREPVDRAHYERQF